MHKNVTYVKCLSKNRIPIKICQPIATAKRR